jgi:hypothetical protein
MELEQMDLLLKRHPGLIEKCRHEAPNNVEIDALSAFLHAFYTGVENIFKRISLELDGERPESELWHARLLENMSRATESRPAVISENLRMQLRGYLDFRHLFRHAYTFQLKWNKMSGLVLELESIYQQFKQELESFFQL